MTDTRHFLTLLDLSPAEFNAMIEEGMKMGKICLPSLFQKARQMFSSFSYECLPRPFRE